VTPKVLDLGAAREIEGPKHTQTGHTIGSPSYMAPEQARGDRDLDGRVDVYALGVLLYVALTCTRPVESDEQGSAIAKLVHGVEILPPRHHRPEIPARLEAIVMRALAWDREQRFASAEALGQALIDARSAGASAHIARAASPPATAQPVPPQAAARSVRPATDAPTRVGRTTMALGLLVASAICVGLGGATFGAVWYVTRAPTAAPPAPGRSTPATDVPAAGTTVGETSTANTTAAGTPTAANTTAANTTAGDPVEQPMGSEPDAGAAPLVPRGGRVLDTPETRVGATAPRRTAPATREDDEPESTSGSGLWLEDPWE